MSVHLPVDGPAARVAFEYNENALWIAGGGRLPQKGTFELPGANGGAPQEVQFRLTVREVKFPVSEPVTVFFYDRDGLHLGTQCLYLDLVPLYELPGIFGWVPRTWSWLAQQLTSLKGRPLRAILTAPMSLVLYCALFAGGWRYYSMAETEREATLIQLKLAPPRFDRDFSEPFGFDAAGRWRNRDLWRVTGNWRLQPGNHLSSKDGALLLDSQSSCVLRPAAINDSAFYDFGLEMKFSWSHQAPGPLALLLRTRGDGSRGYRFEIYPKANTLVVKGFAVGWFGRTRPLNHGREVAFRDFPCCHQNDVFRLLLTAEKETFAFTVILETPDQSHSELVGVHTPLAEVFTDPARSFPWGGFGFAQADSASAARIDLVHFYTLERFREKLKSQ